MARQPSVLVRNQYVYILDNASINVFDCVDSNTGQRDIYYIQKGRIDSAVQFRETRRTPRTPQYTTPSWRPPHHSPSSSDTSEDEQAETISAPIPSYNSDKYIDIIASRRTVTDDELQKVSDKLRFEDDKYKRMATYLEVSYDDVDRIRTEKENHEKSDMILAILKFWKAKCLEPTVGKIGSALEHCGLKKFVTETLKP